MTTSLRAVNSYFGSLSTTGPTGPAGKSISSSTTYESSIKGVTAYLNAANNTLCTPVITLTNNYGQTSINYVYFFTDVSGGTFKITDPSSGICNISAYLVGGGTNSNYVTGGTNPECVGSGQVLSIPSLPLNVGTQYIIQPGNGLSFTDVSNIIQTYPSKNENGITVCPYDVSGNSYIKDPSNDASNNGIIAAAAAGPGSIITDSSYSYYSPYGYPNGSGFNYANNSVTTIPNPGSSFFTYINQYISPNSYMNPSNYGFYTSFVCSSIASTIEVNPTAGTNIVISPSPKVNLGNFLYSPSKSLEIDFSSTATVLSNINSNSVFSTFNLPLYCLSLYNSTNNEITAKPTSNYSNVFPPNGGVPYGNTDITVKGAQGQIIIVVTYVDTQVNNTILTNPF